MQLTEEKIKSELIYDGKIVKLYRDDVRLENDTTAIREVIMHPGGVGILALTEDNEVLMVRQFRYPQNEVLLEIPAGKLEWNEDHLACGKRELLEETGYNAESFEYLGYILPTPAYDTEKTHMYLARGLTLGEQNLDEDEFLEVEKIPFDKLLDMVITGEITDAKTCTAVLKTYYITNKNNVTS